MSDELVSSYWMFYSEWTVMFSWAKVVGWLRSVRQQLMEYMLFIMKNVLSQTEFHRLLQRVRLKETGWWSRSRNALHGGWQLPFSADRGPWWISTRWGMHTSISLWQPPWKLHRVHELEEPVKRETSVHLRQCYNYCFIVFTRVTYYFIFHIFCIQNCDGLHFDGPILNDIWLTKTLSTFATSRLPYFSGLWDAWS